MTGTAAWGGVSICCSVHRFDCEWVRQALLGKAPRVQQLLQSRPLRVLGGGVVCKVPAPLHYVQVRLGHQPVENLCRH